MFYLQSLKLRKLGTFSQSESVFLRLLSGYMLLLGKPRSFGSKYPVIIGKYKNNRFVHWYKISIALWNHARVHCLGRCLPHRILSAALANIIKHKEIATFSSFILLQIINLNIGEK